ncbi:MAG TPA: SDR family NAD(P)-dependent oxidoreductase [Acidimicrobiales bacterium]|nr:SDR family NAD(P)-dependent oxidoreductase [Acidimicrobiales bacterium]
MTLDFGLDGRRALVTGAGQGVGAGIAHTLASAGVEVVVNDFFAERADAVASAIVAAGGRASASTFDVTEYSSVRDAFDAVGAVDILVNNAGNAGMEGFGALSQFVDTSPADWAKYLDVNLRGVMNCVHAAVPAMIDAKWGRIITMVSDAARTGDAQMAAYSAAKAGAAGFCRAIATEVARHGITVNTIALGTMRTPVSAALWDDPTKVEQQRALMSSYLVRRPGEPDDAAWMVATLASPRAAWITGQTIPVNGGRSFSL